MRKRILLPLTVTAALIAPAWSMAQNGGDAGTTPAPRTEDGGRGGRGERGGRRGERGPGGGDPAQWREQMEARLKEQLGASDDEWKVLQPKVQKVGEARRDIMAGAMMGMMGRGRGGPGGEGPGGGGPGGPGGPGGQGAQSPVMQAARDLRTTLDNKNAAAGDITQKLQALRAAKQKAQADLQAAQKDLQGVVTPRQEAVLVSMGLMD